MSLQNVTFICPPSPPTNIMVELFTSRTLAVPGDLLVLGGGFWAALISFTLNEPMFPNLGVTDSCKKSTFRMTNRSTCVQACTHTHTHTHTHLFYTQPPPASAHVSTGVSASRFAQPSPSVPSRTLWSISSKASIPSCYLLLTIVTDNGLNMFQQPTVFIISLFSQITK